MNDFSEAVSTNDGNVLLNCVPVEIGLLGFVNSGFAYHPAKSYPTTVGSGIVDNFPLYATVMF